MRDKIKRYFKRLFCKHDYYKVNFACAEDRHVRYSIRKYECEKCGKFICVDGRYDNINAPWRADLKKVL